MRRAAKVDDNQAEIVSELIAVGATVQLLSMVGEGCPDILVGFRGANYLIEIKDGNKAPSKQKLTPAQVEWHEAWRGQVHVAKNVSEAFRIIKLTVTG